MGSRNRTGWAARLLRAAAAACLLPATAWSGDDAVEDIVAVLREKGLIDEAQQTQILAKNAVRGSGVDERTQQMLSGLTFFADVRLRWEGLLFDRDPLGATRDDFSRFRYRLRFGLEKRVTERLLLGLRLGSNSDDARSFNLTFGDRVDFRPDPVRIDRAFVEYQLPDARFGWTSRIAAGRTQNPFRGVVAGPDSLLWDPDISTVGGGMQLGWQREPRLLFGNLGGYFIEHRAERADSMVYGFQGGGSLELAPGMDLGLRASDYEYRGLDTAFLDRAVATGNLPNAFEDGRARVVEGTLFLDVSRWSGWPLGVYLTLARNLTADSARVPAAGGTTAFVGPEDDALMFGLELGDPERLAHLSVGYFRVEPNGVISPFTDSDLFDGMTNVKGYYVGLARILARGVELRLLVSRTDALRTTGGAAGPFPGSLADRDRLRIQADAIVAF